MRIKEYIKTNRLVIGTGLLFLLLSLGHIPVDIFPHAFDKNAPVHLLLLLLISIIFSIYLIFNHHKLFISGKAVFLIVFMAVVLLFSSLNSPDFYSSLIGDAGRYTGAASLLALLVVAIFHAQLNVAQFNKLILLYTVSIFFIALLGILQHFKILELPGDSGVTSTLGNLDFFTAFIATSFPIFFYLFLTYRGRIRIFLIVMALVNLISIRLSGALQGYVDLGIFAIGLVIYALRKYIPRFNVSLNLKTFIGTTSLIIWLEGIFLMPFLGTFIPVLGSDIQVRIRGQFWLAAINQFFHKPLLGVGPDQYGYYYERFRTIESVNEYPTILANDAHSSTAQSLATLGIFGALAFLALLALLVRSIFILMDREKSQRKFIFSLSLYLFVYLTNATISPITLPNKYVFWAVAGYLVGQAYLVGNQSNKIINLNKKLLLTFLALVSTLNIFVAINHSVAQYQFMDKWDKFAKNQQSQIRVTHNKFLPCTMFYDNLSRIINSQGNMALEKFSQDQVNSNPRCVNAQITMAKLNYNKGDLVAMKKNIYALTEMAPNRSEVLALAGVYARRAEDKDLFDKVTRQYAKLGITPLVVP